MVCPCIGSPEDILALKIISAFFKDFLNILMAARFLQVF